jgi:hypothetical protein
MKLSRGRAVLLGLMTTLDGVAAATPQHLLQDAANNLIAAENYSWDARETTELDGKKMPRLPPDAEGETEIGGFTLLQTRRRPMVVRDQQIVVKLNGGWRHADDFGASEMEELRLPKITVRMIPRYLRRAPPHEILDFVLQHGANLRESSGVIEGDIDLGTLTVFEFQTFVKSGLLPIARPTDVLLKRRVAPAANLGATFEARIAAGKLEELAISTRLSGNVSLQGGPREPHSGVQTYTFRLRDFGRTQVVVEPEAKVLFLNGAARR